MVFGSFTFTSFRIYFVPRNIMIMEFRFSNLVHVYIRLL